METVFERCAGLDVHQETVAACVLFGPLDQSPKMEIRVYRTTIDDLLGLGEWLMDMQCTHVAMESTNDFWKPIWNVLEAFDLELLLANAHHLNNLPGRRTDTEAAERIAEWLRCGLIEGSFVPPSEIRELRDLIRYRRNLIHDADSQKNQIRELLQAANIKLTTHMPDIFGTAGRILLQKIADGEVITLSFLEQQMAVALKHKSAKLLQSLNSRLRKHHRVLIGSSFNYLLFLEQTISSMEQEIRSRLAAK